MTVQLERSRPRGEALSDGEVVARVLAGETALYEVVMRRYNQRLFRVARSVLGDPNEAEDVVQDAWVRAYEKLGQFRGEARFSTWLTRIALYEAMARKRRRSRIVALADGEPGDGPVSLARAPSGASPERGALAAELRTALESAVDALPESLRLAFLVRDVEGMSTSEAAGCLEVSESALKVRLHRARERLRADLESRFGAITSELWAFAGERCDRMVARVLERIGAGG